MATEILTFSNKTDILIAEYTDLPVADKAALIQLNDDIQHINIANRDAWLKQADKSYESNVCGEVQFASAEEYEEYRRKNGWNIDDPQFEAE